MPDGTTRKATAEGGCTERTVTFHPRHEPNDPDPTYRWQVHLHMDWLADGDGLPREEIGHGETLQQALSMARGIAAAFMFESGMDAQTWPSNGIDQLQPQAAVNPQDEEPEVVKFALRVLALDATVDWLRERGVEAEGWSDQAADLYRERYGLTHNRETFTLAGIKRAAEGADSRSDLAAMDIREAATYLGELCGLGCTGALAPLPDGRVVIQHDGATCPIHETGDEK